MMKGRRSIFLVILLLVVSGCATIPTGPSVMVMPPPGKPFEQFQADDAICRQFAYEQVGGLTGQEAAQRSAVSSAVIGTALGAAAGAAIGSVSGSAGAGAAIGAGSGLLLGSAAGTGYASSLITKHSVVTIVHMCSACMPRGTGSREERRQPGAFGEWVRLLTSGLQPETIILRLLTSGLQLETIILRPIQLHRRHQRPK